MSSVICLFHFLALAVYARSPDAYNALKSFKILQLPSKSTVQSYMGAFLHLPGANHNSISEQVAHFLLHCHRRKESKKAGALMSRNVKVHSAKFYFHKPITVQLELYLFYCFIHYLLYIGQY